MVIGLDCSHGLVAFVFHDIDKVGKGKVAEAICSAGVSTVITTVAIEIVVSLLAWSGGGCSCIAGEGSTQAVAMDADCTGLVQSHICWSFEALGILTGNDERKSRL